MLKSGGVNALVLVLTCYLDTQTQKATFKEYILKSMDTKQKNGFVKLSINVDCSTSLMLVVVESHTTYQLSQLIYTPSWAAPLSNVPPKSLPKAVCHVSAVTGSFISFL